ncbi:broad specificity phosphatase PhoE [Rhodoblastus acidophilus]|uniref:histidine phosphatase family protein n=1 Tax=Rhodoblastus acidophilus TaxID=1074 RepID=UPI0022241AA0|nr:histidine phosphatase family protein [Rhodoblastus acidophilus]MCW2285341.1 broad specificity phosphatase PhoE [Rhodoblastus acidophilus]MCW2334297.1 broad specificity phosphatase PhoE [Rhodoblastus acidophilus]
MRTILLVRHAAHDNVGGFLAGRMPGVRLGAAGRAQAERLAKRLASEKLDAVQTSPRERTRETAEAIARASGLGEACIADGLDEIDFGAWTGKTFDALDADPAWRKWNEQRAMARTPAGDSMEQVQARALAHIKTLTAERVALVSHADVIKTVVCGVLGLPLDAGPRFDIALASITRLAAGPGEMKLAGLNEVIW